MDRLEYVPLVSFCQCPLPPEWREPLGQHLSLQSPPPYTSEVPSLTVIPGRDSLKTVEIQWQAWVSEKAPFPCFLLAVHILAAGKKRKEEACSPGEGTPAQIPQDVVSWLPAHPLVTGLLAKVSSEQLRGGKATPGTAVLGRTPCLITAQAPRGSTDTGLG